MKPNLGPGIPMVLVPGGLSNTDMVPWLAQNTFLMRLSMLVANRGEMMLRLPTWNLDENNGEDAALAVDYVKIWASDVVKN